MIQGIGASSGIAVGKAFVLPNWEWEVPDQKIDVADFAVVHQQHQLVALRLLLGRRDRPRADDRSLDIAAGEPEPDARAFELIKNPAERLRLAHAKREGFEFFLQRLAGIVSNTRHNAPPRIDGQRLEHVVHFRLLELQLHRLAGGHVARASADIGH